VGYKQDSLEMRGNSGWWLLVIRDRLPRGGGRGGGSTPASTNPSWRNCALLILWLLFPILKLGLGSFRLLYWLLKDREIILVPIPMIKARERRGEVAYKKGEAIVFFFFFFFALVMFKWGSPPWFGGKKLMFRFFFFFFFFFCLASG
jgi:hypothetical protein